MGSAEHPQTDPLLKIFSDRYLYAALPEEATRALQNSQSLAIIVAAVDDFQQINQANGHGDAVLQHVVNLTRSALRHADWMARHEDDGFVVVLPSTHLDGAYAAAERMRRRFAEKPLTVATSKLVITASFGVACVDPETVQGGDASALLHDARAALRESKRTGRDRVTCGPTRPLRTRNPG